MGRVDMPRSAGAYESDELANAPSIRKHPESCTSMYRKGRRGRWIPKEHRISPSVRVRSRNLGEPIAFQTRGRRSEELANLHNPSAHKGRTSEMYTVLRD